MHERRVIAAFQIHIRLLGQSVIEQDIEVARRQGYFLTHDRLVPRMAGLAAPVPVFALAGAG